MTSSLMKENNDVKKISFYGFLQCIVIVSILILTIILWNISNTQIQEKLSQQFEFQTGQLLALITLRLSIYDNVLRSGVAAIQSHNQQMNTNQWEQFSKSLKIEETYPGIDGIGVIYYVSPDKLTNFVENQRLLQPNFKIHPIHEKSEFWPITYIEPLKVNIKALGLDMAFEKNRLSSAKKARDTATSQITAPIILVQNEKKSPGFLQYVPFYNSSSIETVEQRQKSFIGHVYAPFTMSKLMEGALKQSNRHLIFNVFDNNDVLYNEIEPSNLNFDPEPIFKKEVTVDMYGRPWKFTIQTGRSFREAKSTNQSLFILLGGIITDCLLALIFISVSRSQRKVSLITKKMNQELAANEEYLRHIIEATPCGLLITNEQGLIEKVNPYTERLFGYTEKELIGNNIDSLVPQRSRENHKDHRSDFWKAPSSRSMGVDRDVFGATKQGNEFPAEIGLAQFSGKGGKKTLATVIDMTERVYMIEELKRSNHELNDFAYVASHDLKAPLRGMMQLTNWIEEDIAGTAESETLENLSLLKSRALRLEKLLDDLLTYSRISRKSGSVTTVNPKDLIENLFSLLSPPQNMRLVFQNIIPEITTLTLPLEIIIRNLLGNAIKHHNKPDGEICVSVKELLDSYEFSISDDGPGINPRHHGKIFELFKTLKPRDEVEGSGMGLSLIQKLLDYNKGSITVVSDGINGSCFTFTFPKITKKETL